MDPISLAHLCFKATKLIFDNVKRYREVDETLAILTADQIELSNVMKTFDESMGDGGSMAAPGKEHWQTLKLSMQDLAEALKSLAHILNDVKGDGSGVASRSLRTAKLEMKSSEIDSLQKRITTRIRTIQLSVQFISL